MVNKRERQIQNKAVTIASRDSYEVRETDISQLEKLRTASGLNMGEISDLFGESSNWYSNHKRSGGTHEFSRPDYIRVKDLLEVEYLRDRVEFSTNAVSRGVNNDRGWYEDRLEDGFKIDEYNQIVVFLVTAAVLKNKYDGLDDATLEEFVDLDVVSEEFLPDFQSSVDIDYGH